jgi:probable HAF family extracellular repeat protein
MVGLGDLPGGAFQSGARSVSGDGSIILGTGADDTGDVPFRWEGGVMAGLPRPAGSILYAGGLSANGQVIVGGIDNGLTLEAFRIENGVITTLGDLPGGTACSVATAISADGRVIVGDATTADNNFNTGFRLEDGVMQDLHVKYVEAVSPDGSVVVGGKGGAYRWENGVVTNLGFLPTAKPFSAARAASNFGRVIVGQSAGQAFIWDAEHGMRPLQDVLTGLGLDLTGWHLRLANAVTPDGLTIVGYGQNPAGYTEAWIAQVPEPATLGLLGFGVVFIRRPRRN